MNSELGKKDWQHYIDIQNWNKRHLKGPKPRGSLNRSPALIELHEILNESAGKYGIGRLELVPIRTNGEAVGRYFGAYIGKFIHWRPHDLKCARLVVYSRRFMRRVRGPFAWVESGREWRIKLAAWALKHSCASFDDIRAVFGPRWAYHHRDAILAMSGEQPPVSVKGAATHNEIIDEKRPTCARSFHLRTTDKRKWKAHVEAHYQRPLRLRS